MDFSFTSEQDQLRDTVAKLVSQKYDFDTRRKVAKSEAGWRPEMWSQFAELGLLGAPFTEAEGGFGSGPIEAMIISEEFGKGLVIEPFLQTVVIGGNFFRHGGTDAQKEENIAGIIGNNINNIVSIIYNNNIININIVIYNIRINNNINII